MSRENEKVVFYSAIKTNEGFCSSVLTVPEYELILTPNGAIPVTPKMSFKSTFPDDITGAVLSEFEELLS